MPPRNINLFFFCLLLCSKATYSPICGKIHLFHLGSFLRARKHVAEPGTPGTFYMAQKDHNRPTFRNIPRCQSPLTVPVQITQYQMVLEGVKGHSAMWTRDGIRLIAPRCSSCKPCCRRGLVPAALPPSSGRLRCCTQGALRKEKKKKNLENPAGTWPEAPLLKQRPESVHVTKTLSVSA